MDSGAALYGRAWVNHPEPKHKGRKVDGPILEGSRELAVLDALDPEERDRIKARAKEEAARVMADFEKTRSYR